CPPPASSLSCDGHQQNLHSFPTRRSSDLVDGGNILLVQVDAGGGLGRHRHAGECEWRQCHQRQGTLLGVSHSVGLPISSTRISSTNGRPAGRSSLVLQRLCRPPPAAGTPLLLSWAGPHRAPAVPRDPWARWSADAPRSFLPHEPPSTNKWNQARNP